MDIVYYETRRDIWLRRQEPEFWIELPDRKWEYMETAPLKEEILIQCDNKFMGERLILIDFLKFHTKELSIIKNTRNDPLVPIKWLFLPTPPNIFVNIENNIENNILSRFELLDIPESVDL